MKRALLCLALALAYGAVPLLLAGHDYLMSLLIAALTIGGVALAWALLGNLGGMVSFGHAAFFGVGGYVSAELAKYAGVPVPLALLAGGAGATLAAAATLPALRLRGPYFALAILAYAEIFRILATELAGLTGGPAGILSIPPLPRPGLPGLSDKTGAYLLLLTVLVLAMLGYRRLRDSHWGLALRAMHGSEDATRVVGVPSTRLKAAMLAASAFLTGVIGAINAHVIGFLEPDYAFSGVWSVAPIVAAIFGGYRTIAGPVIGAVAVYLLDQLLFKALMPQGHQVMYGVMLAGMVLLSPTGLLPLLGRLGRRRQPATGQPGGAPTRQENGHAAAA